MILEKGQLNENLDFIIVLPLILQVYSMQWNYAVPINDVNNIEIRVFKKLN